MPYFRVGQTVAVQDGAEETRGVILFADPYRLFYATLPSLRLRLTDGTARWFAPNALRPIDRSLPMPVLDLRQDSSPAAGREDPLRAEAERARAAAGHLGLRITPTLRDRARNTYTTIPGTGFTLNVDPTEDSIRAFLTLIDGLRDVLSVYGLEEAARRVSGLTAETQR